MLWRLSLVYLFLGFADMLEIGVVTFDGDAFSDFEA